MKKSVDLPVGLSELSDEASGFSQFDSEEELLLSKVFHKTFDDLEPEALEEISKLLTPYVSLLKDTESARSQRLGVYEELAKKEEIREALKNNTKITAFVAAQKNGAFLAAPQNLEVTGDKAESYGYEDQCSEGVSTLDVLVAEHELLYGTSFTKDTAEKYLKMTEYGYVERIFETKTQNVLFAVNGENPHDDVLNLSEDGNYYTGYLLNQAEVGKEDVVEFLIFEDGDWAKTYLPANAGKPIQVKRAETAEIGLKGYSIGYYGCSEQSVIDANMHALNQATLAWVDTKTGELTPVQDVTVGTDGIAKMTFKREGSYLLSAQPKENAEDFFRPLIFVEVTANEELDKKDAQVIADWMDQKIEGIGEVTLEKEAKILAIADSYDSLTELEQSYVTQLPLLRQIQAELSELKQQKAKEDEEKAQQEKQAEEKEREQKESIVIQTFVTAQAEGSFLAVPQTLTVDAYKAESYGYQDDCKQEVSTLDVLVAEHEIIFGRSFSEKTARQYLDLSEGGFVLSVFGKNTGNLGFVVNGQTPHEDTLVESEYGNYYPSYFVNQAAVPNHAMVEFFIYQDSGWSDLYITNAGGSSVTVKQSEPVKLSLSGYSIGHYGSSEQSVIEENTHAWSSAVLAKVEESTGELIPLELTTDEQGTAELTFEERGDYLITATEESEEKKVFLPLIRIHVVENEEQAAKEEEAKKAAGKVDELIASIGNVSLSKEAEILAAKAAFEALTPEAQLLVSKKDLLSLMEQEVAGLKKAEEENKAALQKLTEEKEKLEKEKSELEQQNQKLSEENEALKKNQSEQPSVQPADQQDKTQTIQINQTKIQKKEGAKAFTLKAKAQTAMTFSSSDSTVAKVDSNTGKVTITGAGKVVITITASGAGYQTATKKVTIFVKPAKQKIKSLKGKKDITVTFKKNKKATGYQIVYSTSKGFKSAKKIKVAGSKNTKKGIKGVKAGKTYYVKVRSFVKAGTKTLYGAYSPVKKIQMK